MKNALILLAGGKGTRFRSRRNNVPKQFIKFGSRNLIEYFLDNLNEELFDLIVIVTNKRNKTKYLKNLSKIYSKLNIKFTNEGINRQKSVKNGLVYLKKYNPKNVFVHDSARPLVSNSLFKRLNNSLKSYKSITPYIKNNDLSKSIKNGNIFNDIISIQTPQAFKYKTLLNAHKKSNLKNSRDDTMLTESINIKTKYIKGEKTNIKITFYEDINIFEKYKFKEFRSGIGYDIHKIDYTSKKFLKLCGVKIKHPPLIGHSDADVGYHAICDSILGSLSLKDIGFYFNNKSLKWKNANSKIFMNFCYDLLKKKKYKIVNLDINFICEKPKISIYINRMKDNITKILHIKKTQISIKSTTNEKIGFIGKKEGIAAESIILIKNE